MRDKKKAIQHAIKILKLYAPEMLAEDQQETIARLEGKLDKAAPWSCPECGPHVKVDEDGCCIHCGHDANPDAALAESEDAQTDREHKDGGGDE